MLTFPVERHELSWCASTMSHLDLRTAQSETEVRQIIDLQIIAQSMPDAFRYRLVRGTSLNTVGRCVQSHVTKFG